MTNWKSPEVIAQHGVIFVRFMHTLIGLYLWEWFVSLDFDWAYLTGKKAFRWPLFFYFLCRYAQLLALIGVAVSFNIRTEINCQAFYVFNAAMGNISLGAASINLSLRTMAAWACKWYIVLPLMLIILGHWSLLLHGILLKAQWEPGRGCVITETNNAILSATFIYSMCFDFVVLCLTGFRLFGLSSNRSRLVSLIVHDGLIYFIVAFLANMIATVFILLDLNAVMSVIANVPAGIAATIVACRAVRRLVNIPTERGEMFTGVTSTSSTRMTDVPFESVIRGTGSKRRVRAQRSEKLDAPGNTTSVFDPEDLIIGNDLKRVP